MDHGWLGWGGPAAPRLSPQGSGGTVSWGISTNGQQQHDPARLGIERSQSECLTLDLNLNYQDLFS